MVWQQAVPEARFAREQQSEWQQRFIALVLFGGFNEFQGRFDIPFGNCRKVLFFVIVNVGFLILHPAPAGSRIV